MELIHGGDWAGYEMEYGAPPLDFSVNISPIGMPEGARWAAATALDNAGRYPDPLCRALREKLAERYDVPGENIVCGNGASDLIWRLARTVKPKHALVLAPTFAEYQRALDAAGCDTARFALREEDRFAVPAELLDHIAPGLDMLFLCNPNNPTGQRIDPALLAAVLRRCARTGTSLVVDECFLDFVEDGERYSLAGKLGEYSGLVVINAFTKTYAMAGLRLGYALCGDQDLAEKLLETGLPWAVSAVAQAAGVAALDDTGYMERVRSLLALQKARMTQCMEKLGLEVIPGEANFLLFRSGVENLCQKLREKGVLLRDCANFAGLGPGWYRTAVRGSEENGAFLRALGEVLMDG